ncbi:response regulator transcription factor [Actinomycetospora sp. CA-084318]|uniref:response regulator transcription factor n=1 Tax=Actinomycetospora sp. CA-084318 TaxID=3239892 RepID=UPI003D962E7E
MRVAVAEDSRLFRQALVDMLGSLGLEVVIATGRADDLLLRLEGTTVDVVLLDIRMPPTRTDEGLRAAERIRRRHPHIGILVLSTFTGGHYAERLLTLGDRGVGYLLKDDVDNVDTLGDALRRVASGGCIIDPTVISALLARQRHIKVLERLNESERRVLVMMAEGQSNAGIAATAKISKKTVEKHITAVFGKLDLPWEENRNRRVLAVLEWLRAMDA